MTDRELMQQALIALEVGGWNMTTRAIIALRERLEQPMQTVSMHEYKRLQKLVTSQGIKLMGYESAQPEQKREWVGLTDADIAQSMHGSVEGSNMLPYQFARAIEAKLKEKNCG